MVGIPGSGKSTWAEQFVAQQVLASRQYQQISTDDVRAQLYGDAAVQGEWRKIWAEVMRQLRICYALIEQGQLAGAIYDATNARRRDRREALSAFRTLGFGPIEAVWLDTPLAVCLLRNRGRSRQVPIDVIERMHRQLTDAPPTRSEDFDVIQRIQP